MHSASFNEVMRSSTTAANAYFRVFYRDGPTEAGLIVSAKVGNSVVRSRLSRLLRVELRKASGRVVVLATPRAAELNGHQDDVHRRLEPLLCRVGAR